MDEAAKFDLEKRVDLYKFYVDLYTKGIVIFIAITSFVLKAAFDDIEHRVAFGVGGSVATLLILIPLIFAGFHERTMRDEFTRLAALTQTTAVSTKPLRALMWSTAAYWVLVLSSWIFVVGLTDNDLPRLFQPFITEDFKVSANSFGVR